ncbi:topology modulation protein [Guptibacillus hwajinpoensis]|uniref:Topology modulation protein n=1 Tax=Guptibacillus hwajinpoensis TaxID=208199 RepID=A0A0J6FUI3_9BACL|nr:topology modulation protein [Alkalihalobacillus macyae]KMM38017.1 topology modulation protein [Alkalihalobacillus macyae]
MKRILVMGISAGAGKSTFARKLGDLLHINVHHLDTLFWKPGWKESSIEEFRSSLEEIVTTPTWIIEGNYSNTYDIRATHADTIIYLEVPRLVCLYRVLKRWLTHLGQTRPDMAEGCKEKMELSFLKFIWTTYYPRKEKMYKRFEQFQETGQNKTVIKLKNKAQIHDFFHELERKHTIL